MKLNCFGVETLFHFHGYRNKFNQRRRYLCATCFLVKVWRIVREIDLINFFLEEGGVSSEIEKNGRESERDYFLYHATDDTFACCLCSYYWWFPDYPQGCERETSYNHSPQPIHKIIPEKKGEKY